MCAACGEVCSRLSRHALRYIGNMNLRRGVFLRRHVTFSYFALTFAISWAGALAVAAPHLLRREALPKFTGILMFPAMLLGPCLTGIALTAMLGGKAGLRDLARRMVRWRIPPSLYAAMLIPPVLIFGVLFGLEKFLSPVYAPNLFPLGILFGVPAGIAEEIGWTGFVYPKMAAQGDAFGAAVLLGLLWSCWHLPVVNYLGTATPHGDYWLQYFLAFSTVMTAMRVLIAWVYTNSGSVLLAQLLHVSSTGSLVVLSATRVSAGQEAMWYLLYGALLWVAVAAVVSHCGNGLRLRRLA